MRNRVERFRSSHLVSRAVERSKLFPDRERTCFLDQKAPVRTG